MGIWEGFPNWVAQRQQAKIVIGSNPGPSPDQGPERDPLLAIQVPLPPPPPAATSLGASPPPSP